MNAAAFRTATHAQFDATIAMLGDAIRRCPPRAWAKPVGVWPFWLVAYHTICYLDVYASTSNRAWRAHPVFHPRGRRELEAEFPSREFSRDELLEYLALAREKLSEALTRETARTLAGRSGFTWLKMTRAQAHLYNLRHVAHHAGQLSAALRRAKVRVAWVKRGRARP
jgi:hypothetical protein